MKQGQDRRLRPQITRICLLPLLAVIWNELIYYGANLIAGSWPHRDWTMPVDHVMPFLPWTVAIYYGCFLFWAVNYFLIARQEQDAAYRFFLADFLTKVVCLFFFLLLPTTNVRPVVDGSGLWDCLMRILYETDAPSNLFPSIHCLVSWLCWIGVRKRADVPLWYQGFSLIMAVAVCVSTLTTRQHVLFDVIGGILLAELGYWAAGLEPLAWRYRRIMNRLIMAVSKNEDS